MNMHSSSAVANASRTDSGFAPSLPPRMIAIVAIGGVLISAACAAFARYRCPSLAEALNIIAPGFGRPTGAWPWDWFLAGIGVTSAACLLLFVRWTRRLRGRGMLTIRDMMCLVLAVALLSAGPGVLRNRRLEFEKIAEFHRDERIPFDVRDHELEELRAGPLAWSDESFRERFRSVRRAAEPLFVYYEYHDRMAAKYDAAVRRPWNLVAADPPPPPEPSREIQRSIVALLRHQK